MKNFNQTTPKTKSEVLKTLQNCTTYFSAFKLLIQIENDYNLKKEIEDFDSVKTALVSTFNIDEGFMFPCTYVGKDCLINYASVCRRLKI